MDSPDAELDPFTLAIHQFIALACFHFTSHPVVYILFSVLFAQIIMILLLLFDNELREPLVDWLDELSKSPITLLIIKIGTTVFGIMISNLYRVFRIRRRCVDSVNSGNDVIIAYRILEAFLMGFSLFLLLVMKNIHQYIKEVVIVTNTIWASRKQTLAYQDDRKMSADEANLIRTMIRSLKTEITKLESECNAKQKVLQSELAINRALKDHFEGLHVEYDRLLAYNEDVRDQLQEVKEILSQSRGNDDLRDRSRDINERLSYSSGKEDHRDRSHNINEKLSHYSDKKTGFFSWNLWGL